MTGSRITRVLRNSWVLAIVCAIIGLGTGILSTSYREPPAVIAQDMHEVDKVVARGGWIRLHVRFLKNADCQADVHRFLWQWTGAENKSDRRWVPLGSAPAPPSTFGENSFELDLPLPSNIDPGIWYYRGETRRECNFMAKLGGIGHLFQNLPHDTDDILVPVVDPPKSAVAAPSIILPKSEHP